MSLIPLSQASAASLAAVRIVLTDIDDTLTSEGRLTAAAYAALEALEDAGLVVIPLTGRPAGWCDMIARFWPVAGVVGENGALAFRYDRAGRRMIRLYAKSEAERMADRARLDALAQRILAEVPGARIAADQAYRIADLAIDIREDGTPLSQASIRRILTLFGEAGATAKPSSIHVNGWFGAYDKLSMTRRLLAEQFGAALDDRTLFIGDSPNDEPLFAALKLTVGVANIMDFAQALKAKPAYVTKGRGGAGFAEMAKTLLEANPR
jgi:HAD superfamily hydrolase (TIGR01484 family)